MKVALFISPYTKVLDIHTLSNYIPLGITELILSDIITKSGKIKVYAESIETPVTEIPDWTEACDKADYIMIVDNNDDANLLYIIEYCLLTRKSFCLIKDFV